MSNIKSANGISGIILRSHSDEGGCIFRVYDNNGGFKDYDLLHSDLCVTITDSDAYFYEDDEILDCSTRQHQ